MDVNFFERYRSQCKECNGGKDVEIPANDPENGQPGNEIDILFVNERPGPTAIKTGLISFYNPDESARRFKRLFEKTFGLKYRKKIFSTNAVLWCPKIEKPKNINPNEKEVKDGVENLSDQIRKIKPKVIVAMGRKALNALSYCFDNENLKRSKRIKLKNMVGNLITKMPYKIIPLFHTSPLNIRNRSESEQLEDWQKMARHI